MNSGQRFRIEISLIFRIIELINQGMTSFEKLKDTLGLGKNKIETYKDYLRILDLIEYDKSEISITNFGQIILKLRYNPEVAQSLLYYKLCRGYESNGHFYYSRLANDILFEIAFRADNTITNKQIREKIVEFKDDIPNVNVEDVKKLISQAASTLADESDGFGRLGILKKIEKEKYIVNYFKPHYLICAYIIYDKWPKGDTAVDFDYIIKGSYNLRKLFFLFPEDIHGIFSKLEQEKYLIIESRAGLNQVVKNPKITTDIILEAITNAC
ncbi:MAG TPA: DUF4007 family protein [Candidatus Paceibacterota bacterium]